VLPVKSTAFSEQTWPGKKTDEDKQSKNDKASKKTETKDNQKSGNENKGSILTEEQKRFYHLLENEIRQVRFMQMNDGKPSGELKALDTEAWKQLESRLSDEDQYAIFILYFHVAILIDRG
jgi:hypothetical protein